MPATCTRGLRREICLCGFCAGRTRLAPFLSVPRVWDTSQQAIFNRRAAAREGENTEVGTRFLCLLRMFLSLMPLSLTTEKKLFCQTSAKEKRCNSKKIATLSKSCSVLSRTFLFALFFDFGNLFCRCGHNPYACIAHTVKKRVELPPLRVLLRRRFQKELVYGYIVAEHKLKENL